MSHGYPENSITPLANRRVTRFEGVPSGTMLTDVLNEIDAGEYFAVFGIWPGDPRARWIWFHGYALPRGTGNLFGWDEILGDHVVCSPFQFGGCALPINNFYPGVGAYIPYF